MTASVLRPFFGYFYKDNQPYYMMTETTYWARVMAHEGYDFNEAHKVLLEHFC